jgi:hypothetical protein
MVDPVTLARRKKRLYGGIAICAVGHKQIIHRGNMVA